MDQIKFAQTLEQLKDTARLQGNMITNEQLQEAFEEMELNDDQMALILDYLDKSNIGVDKPGKTDENLSSEDTGYLEMYLEELKELPTISDGEKRAIMMSAVAGDSDACNKLVEIFLPQVVEIAKLYAGQGALIEDLIGEGNVAVAMATTMLDCVEGIDEIDGFIGKMIMDAMEEFIGEDVNNKQADESVLEKVNEVFAKSKEMAEDLLRKVTVEEVAKEMQLSEDDIREAIRLSANNIDYIEEETDGEQ